MKGLACGQPGLPCPGFPSTDAKWNPKPGDFSAGGAQLGFQSDEVSPAAP